jgi:ketosteroid isomerase-like protein
MPDVVDSIPSRNQNKSRDSSPNNYEEIIMSDSTGGPNVEQLRSGYQAFGNGDMAALDTLFADDVVWHVAGGGSMAGEFVGKEQVFGQLGQFMERSGGTYKIEPHDFLASHDHGVVLSKSTASREGRQLDARFVDIFHVSDDRVTEWWSSSIDQAENDAFWA